jgi:hypothetical protein
MRITRQRAARDRQLLQQQQQLQPEQLAPSIDEPMAVEPAAFNLDPLTQRDPQLCHHYTKEIYSYLRNLEMDHRVSPHFMQVRAYSPLHAPLWRQHHPPSPVPSIPTCGALAASGLTRAAAARVNARRRNGT